MTMLLVSWKMAEARARLCLMVTMPFAENTAVTCATLGLVSGAALHAVRMSFVGRPKRPNNSKRPKKPGTMDGGVSMVPGITDGANQKVGSASDRLIVELANLAILEQTCELQRQAAVDACITLHDTPDSVAKFKAGKAVNTATACSVTCSSQERVTLWLHILQEHLRVHTAQEGHLERITCLRTCTAHSTRPYNTIPQIGRQLSKPHSARARPQDLGRKDVLPIFFDEVGIASLELLFPGFTDDITEHASLITTLSRNGCKRTADVARAAHLGALVAARPRIQAMMHDASTARLDSADPLMDRLDLLVQTATTTFTETLDDSQQAAAIRYLQEAALTAD